MTQRLVKIQRNTKGIQEDMYRMQKWAEEWNLYFNVNKCKGNSHRKKTPKHEYYCT